MTQHAHLHDTGIRTRAWSQVSWGLQGQTPTISHYDQPRPDSDDPFWRRIWAGIFNTQGRLPLSAPTMTRRARVSAQVDSIPAARFFNQAGSWAGTGRHWSGGFVPGLRPSLHQNFNPNMQGAAELHPATTYDPFPSPSALYPKAV